MNENQCSNHEIHVLFEHGLQFYKISRNLFVLHYTESFATWTYHYVYGFVPTNVVRVMTL